MKTALFIFRSCRCAASVLLPTYISPIKAAVRSIRFLIVKEHSHDMLAFFSLSYFLFLGDSKKRKVSAINTFYLLSYYFPFVFLIFPLALAMLCASSRVRDEPSELLLCPLNMESRLTLLTRPFKNQ